MYYFILCAVGVITKRKAAKTKKIGEISWSKEHSLTQKYQKKGKGCRLVMTATVRSILLFIFPWSVCL